MRGFYQRVLTKLFLHFVFTLFQILFNEYIFCVSFIVANYVTITWDLHTVDVCLLNPVHRK